MPRASLRILGIMTVVAAFGSGCRSPSPDTTAVPAIAAETREALSTRAIDGMTRGFLSKPDADFEAAPDFALAPLLIVEATADMVSPGIGTPGRAGDGSVVVDPDRPTVYADHSTTQIRERAFERRSYVWWHGAGADVALQGVRMTLDDRGSPFLWEVLSDSSGARLVFVDRALEEAASAALGPPLPGREYSVERSLEEAPAVIVVRVIESGATPLGPFVYLGQDGRDVHTVLCRCMDSEVNEIVGLDEYRLQPLDSLPSPDLAVAWDPGSPEAWLRFPDDWPADE